MRQQPPASWGTPPPPGPPTANGLPWYQRWWWAVALAAFLMGTAFAGASQPEPSRRSGRSPRCRSVQCGRPSARRSPTNLSGGSARASWPATTGRSSRRPPRPLLLQRPRRGDPGRLLPRPADRDRRPPSRPSRRRGLAILPTRTSVSQRRRRIWTALMLVAATSRSCPPTRTGCIARAKGWAARAREPLLALHPIENRMALDHPDGHPDDPSGSFKSRLERQRIQREQARSVWSRPDRRRAPVS